MWVPLTFPVNFISPQASCRVAAKTSGSVTTVTVSLMRGSVMEMETAWMGLMKWIAQVSK